MFRRPPCTPVYRCINFFGNTVELKNILLISLMVACPVMGFDFGRIPENEISVYVVNWTAAKWIVEHRADEVA